ncbi:MAG: hypothetical protein IPP15_18855 [Saprospiraceae bacterium]|uniref:DUF7718 domain-containing protein n=1 Tax=Candidatus Opimibacter skivensis TaxID=2982028 RepID=A0A9D7SYP8_9BACT|nr:hypothetical protein [Candidatus Opimibacter skivensis]
MNAKEINHVQELGDSGDRLRFRFIVISGKGVVELSVQIECLDFNGNYVSIVRYDTSHGYFHKDVYCDGKKIQHVELSGFSNYSEALEYAKKDLINNYERYKFEYNNCKR